MACGDRWRASHDASVAPKPPPSYCCPFEIDGVEERAGLYEPAATWTHTGMWQVGGGSLHHVIPKQWRQRLAYTGMSLLVTWHTLAMVVAPSPDSDITDAARSVLDPYLTLFRLDNGWGFFAPEVGRGSQFRYVVEDAAGNRTTFIPAETLNRFHPSSIWIRDRYIAVMEKPKAYADAAGAVPVPGPRRAETGRGHPAGARAEGISSSGPAERQTAARSGVRRSQRP